MYKEVIRNVLVGIAVTLAGWGWVDRLSTETRLTRLDSTYQRILERMEDLERDSDQFQRRTEAREETLNNIYLRLQRLEDRANPQNR